MYFFLQLDLSFMVSHEALIYCSEQQEKLIRVSEPISVSEMTM